MKKNLTKLIAAILLVASALACLAGCGSSDQNGQTTTEATAAATDGLKADGIPVSPLEPVDYEGHVLRICTHYMDGSSCTQWEFFTEGYTGVAINDEIYERSIYISEKYNVDFEYSYSVSFAFDNCVTAMSAGEDQYDLILPGVAKALEWASRGFLTEVNSIPNLDLSADWWNQDFLEASSVEHKNYSLIGSMNILAYDSAAAGFFNKDVVETYQMENPYDLVNNNQWTMEKLFDMAKEVPGDHNGDSTMDWNDRYILSVNSYAALTFSYGADIQLSSKNDQDIPEILSLNPGFIDHFQNMVEKISKNPDVFYAEGYGTENRTKYPQEMFFDDRIFFCDGTMANAAIYGREDVNYGLVPLPKASSDQQNYGSFIHYGHSSVTVVPAAARNKERTGHILEDIAYYSHYYLYPVYLEETVKTRYMRDPEASKNVDLVLNSICYDFVNMMNNEMIEDLRALMTGKDTDIASKFKSKQRTYHLALKRMIEGIQKVNATLDY